MILAVVGSTMLDSGEQTDAARKLIRATLVYPWLKIVSGGAVGIDSLAEQIAAEEGFDFEKFLPENRRWAPNGYKARNMQIAETCSHLLCIRTSQSKTYGSGWTADYAEKLGKTVHREKI